MQVMRIKTGMNKERTCSGEMRPFLELSSRYFRTCPTLLANLPEAMKPKRRRQNFAPDHRLEAFGKFAQGLKR